MRKNKTTILIIDDDAHILFTLKILLERYFSNVLCEKTPEKIPSVINSEQVDAILLDMNYKPGETTGEEGLKWIHKILSVDPHISIVPITAYGGIDMAVEALKAGAVDFIVKPWQNEKMVSTITSAVNFSKSKRNITKLTEQNMLLNPVSYKPVELIGNSNAIKSIRETIKKVADTDANVLITGENGTGKELVAKKIHQLSERKNEVFMGIDLGSITESLFESELFGYTKGAFTDAKENKIGRIEAADNGTLFFDEIGNIPLNIQSKLLTVLQNRELVRLGSVKPVEINVRLISATNNDLKKMLQSGSFRTDLYYRLNTVEIHIPPLRSRKEDVEVLANYFLEKFTLKYKKAINPVNAQVINMLKQYDWPGNIRELQHTIERAVILSESKELKCSDFQFKSLQTDNKPVITDFNLENLEKWAIQSCLEKHNGHITHVAEELGITRGALYRRLEKYELQ